MSGSSPPEEAAGKERAHLVAGVLWLVQEWRRILDMGAAMPRPALEYMRSRSRELQGMARRVGFGGIAVHLERATAACEPPLDVAKVQSALQDVWEITRHARDELDPVARRQVDEAQAALSVSSLKVGGAGGGVAPPPLITVYPSGGRPESGDPRPAEPPGPEERWSPSVPPRSELGRAAVQDPFTAPPPSASGRGSPPPPRRESDPAPNLQVRTMFGLRAFGRSKVEGSGHEEPPRKSSLFGLRKGSSRASGENVPPRMLSSSLPSLARPEPVPQRGEFKNVRFDSDSPEGKPARPWDREAPVRDSDVRRKKPARLPRRGAGTPSVGPWLAGLGVGALAVIAVTIVIVVRQAPPQAAPVPSGGAAVATAAPAATERSLAPATNGTATSDLPRSRLLTDDEQFRSLLSQIHGRGGKESPELRALLDEQAAVQSKLLKAGKCEGNAACSEWEKARGLLTETPTKPITHRRQPPSDGMAPAWMNGFRLPEKLPIEDDPLVKRYFQQYAENRVGRETLQSMLFRCGAYRDLIRATLIRYDVPEGVLALVLVESGCEPLARSPVGALGMWQFMPDSGRGYGLRLIENVLDERQSPAKSTEAGVHFLSDLYAKLGSWDLVFAAYNLGPFGLLARLHKAGDDAGFWDLVDADMLPDETAQYVPRIEALALILSNLQRLRFAGLQMRAPDDTADLEVASSTRLSLIARAAATSTDEIRRKNRDILGDRTPSLPGERFSVQVPSSVVEQARETLQDLLAHRNDEDTCVPSSFDWGRQRFTPEMAEACKKRAPPTDVSPGPPQ